MMLNDVSLRFVLIQPPVFARPSRSRYERNAAPTITPHTLPMPPRMTMQRMKTEMLKKKSPGKVALLKLA
jgi:hypothetical protein